MEKKQAKKKAGTRGMRLWYAKLVHQVMSDFAGLYIVTRSRNIELAVKKAQITIRRYYTGRVIDSIEYKGTLDN